MEGGAEGEELVGELDEEAGGGGEFGEDGFGGCWAENTGGGGEGVAAGGVGGDDGAGDAGGEAECGVWVDDVGVAGAVDFDGLMEVAGGGDGAVVEQEFGRSEVCWELVEEF